MLQRFDEVALARRPPLRGRKAAVAGKLAAGFLTAAKTAFDAPGNLTSAHGVTEGSPSADHLTGQDAAQANYGRPLLGRNVRLVVSRH